MANRLTFKLGPMYGRFTYIYLIVLLVYTCGYLDAPYMQAICLGCPAGVRIVSKLVYNLLTGPNQPTYIYIRVLSSIY